jgi:biotin synthase
MVHGVKALGLETCMTLGMLTPQQAASLADAGLDYYNHNIDTSERILSADHHHAQLRRPSGNALQCP